MTVKIRVWIDNGTTSLEDIVEIPNDEWAKLTEKEREDRLEEEAKDFMGNTVDYGAHVL